jgi:hypothetical protein
MTGIAWGGNNDHHAGPQKATAVIGLGHHRRRPINHVVRPSGAVTPRGGGDIFGSTQRD